MVVALAYGVQPIRGRHHRSTFHSHLSAYGVRLIHVPVTDCRDSHRAHGEVATCRCRHHRSISVPVLVVALAYGVRLIHVPVTDCRDHSHHSVVVQLVVA